ncbi:MAG: L,D-transpeptidase, partial [Eggerthellaceae bacterium]|nr:L,D-transpeptidase [Eggerthellaceae bacterium]
QNPTVHGTFQAIGQSGEWYYMKNSNVWVKWAFLIDGNYFFHSVLFTNRGDPNPTKSSVANLGKNASHGCIRMAVEDCKWVYENCRAGMTVVIGD